MLQTTSDKGNSSVILVIPFSISALYCYIVSEAFSIALFFKKKTKPVPAYAIELSRQRID